MLQDAQALRMDECCVGMRDTMMRDMPSTVVQAPSCSGACCYVSSQIPQARVSSPQFLADSTSALELNLATILPVSNAKDNHESVQPRSAQARYVLLKTFRI
jgi:hypothetical protein